MQNNGDSVFEILESLNIKARGMRVNSSEAFRILSFYNSVTIGEANVVIFQFQNERSEVEVKIFYTSHVVRDKEYGIDDFQNLLVQKNISLE